MSFICNVQQALDRFAPGMECQVEETPVDRQKKLTPQCKVSFHRFFRAHVDVGPILTIGADFQHGEIEGTIGIANLLKSREKSRIGPEEKIVSIPADHERRPKRLIPSPQTAPREMPGWGGRNVDVLIQRSGLPPVQLRNPRPGHTP